MTELYRRRAGEPVEVWEVGSEPVPKWAAEYAEQYGGTRWAYVFAGWHLVRKRAGGTCDEIHPDAFARDYEPAPDAREALEAAFRCIASEHPSALLDGDNLTLFAGRDPHTCDVTINLREVIDAALARMGGGE